MTVADKLSALRRAMLENQIDAYVVPSTDPHQSEYPAPRWAARQWLSGFTGSAGTLVVTLHESKLWTDGRYFNQAVTELDGTEIELMKDRQPGTPTIEEWLGTTLMSGQTVGADGRVISAASADRMRGKLEAEDLHLNLEEDLLRNIWEDRPAVPNAPVFEHSEKLAGERWQDRLERLMAWQGENGLDYFIVSALDEIAWLLNMRGSDIEFNPLCVAYLIVGTQGDHALFAAARSGLDHWTNNVGEGQTLDIHDYKKISSFLRRINATDADIGFDPATLSYRLAHYAGDERSSRMTSPIPSWKAIKNGVALEHLRNTMRQDAVALLKLMTWIERHDGLTEFEIGQQITTLRAEHPDYVSDSFPAIVGYAANGAIIHYRAPEKGSSIIQREGLLLIDSGGQYTTGTTDITRTIVMGELSEEMKRCYTRVLQGHINLAMAKWPEGTTGLQLDVLARAPLWQDQEDYGHGTGHGVGYFLNVHEGPMGIHARVQSPTGRIPLQAGMVLSNEPGYYLDDGFGIRIENLVVVQSTGKEGWLEFETLTLFPLDQRPVLPELLTKAQNKWLNDYQRRVYEELAPLVEGAELDYLTTMTGQSD